MKRQWGALVFVMAVTAIMTLQVLRQRNSVHQEDLASQSPRANSCRYQMLQEPLTPEALQNFVSQTNPQQVQDLVCCLPEPYRKNYVIMHSSFALQAGIPDSPRVLLSSPNSDSTMILTITGSRLPVSGTNHIEILYSNPANQRSELFDLDLNSSAKRLERNPATCMGCHSPNLKELEVAGAKPIFQEFPWPGTVGFSRHLDDSKSKIYFQNIESKSLNSLRVDPAYSCLIPQDLDTLATTVAIYDDVASSLNGARLARLIMQTKDYKKFRPLLGGIAQGCFPQDSLPGKSALDFFESEFPKWIPERAAESLFTDDHFISPNLRSLDHLWQWSVDQIGVIEGGENAVRAERSRQQLGRVQAIAVPSKNFSALYEDDISVAEGPSQYRTIKMGELTTLELPKTLTGYSKITQLLARYAVDTESSPHFTAGVDPYIRFLFEARGISILTWSKEMAGSYGAHFRIPTGNLRQLDRSDSFWKNISSRSCESLRDESYRNFSSNP